MKIIIKVKDDEKRPHLWWNKVTYEIYGPIMFIETIKNEMMHRKEYKNHYTLHWKYDHHKDSDRLVVHNHRTIQKLEEFHYMDVKGRRILHVSCSSDPKKAILKVIKKLKTQWYSKEELDEEFKQRYDMFKEES